ncbi:uncharacterized protein LY89DRAFT_684463 [Mollisia scopiformis]|uniref:Uncharacterized protein n=1 Tax=Mollisia scopiformis TaxID=149040 RepID=A0A194XCD5_MOLSC|nr:uncharacterized protein LY89DRAFT_684463 [Mollisia scopiformis]KUJ17412.1 hypothetical protein LY89DRAFT_684463 [Mollisia scopiformis]
MLAYSRPILILLAFQVHGFYAVPIPNATCTLPPSSNSSLSLTQGWTPSASGRGTIDIVWSCAVTMFLCSWSVLCLQVPSEKDTRFDILWRRCWLTFLCALGPEFTLQLAMGQWSSARQSVKDFHASGFTEWTMKHAFYANSGGFKLRTPDDFTIPIDAKQLLYLINHNYIAYPTLSVQDIEDKNKVDLLLRLISNAQTIWFCITVVARGAEGLVITGMELTTAAFILCSFGTSFCWWNKGADVAVSVKLETTSTMVQIVKDAGDAAAAPYHRTPLDFISREEWHWSLYWTHWINILRVMHINFAPRALPHDRLENTIWLNITARGAFPAFVVMCLAYTAIFVAAWNAYFPTYAEQIIWRISSLSLIATVVLYFVITAFAWVVCPALHRYFHPKATSRLEVSPQSSSSENKGKPAPIHQLQTPPFKRLKPRSRLSAIAASLRNNSVLKDPLLDVPLKATLPIYVVAFFYCSSRTLILILDMIQLRSLPTSAFDTVNWGAFLPHFS